MLRMKLRRISPFEISFLLSTLLWITIYEKSTVVLVIMMLATIGVYAFAFIGNYRAASSSFNRTFFYVLVLLSVIAAIYDLYLFGIVRGIQTAIRSVALYSPIFAFEYCRIAYDQERNQNNMKWYMIILTILSLCQLYLYVTAGYDYARVAVSRNGALFSFFSSPYGLAYSSCFLAIVLLEKLTGDQCKKKKIYCFLLVINVLTVLYTKSLLTLVGLLICMTLVMITNRKYVGGKRAGIVFGVLVLLILFIFVFIMRKEIGSFITLVAGTNDLNAYTRKMKEISMFLTSGAQSENMQGRGEVYLVSLKSILAHPILGSYISNNATGGLIGNHSEILDTFANYGSLYGILLFLVLYKNMTRQRKIHTTNVYIVMFLFIAFVNPIHHYISYFSLFFLVPAYLEDWC